MARTFITIDLDESVWRTVQDLARRHYVSDELMCSFLLESHVLRSQALGLPLGPPKYDPAPDTAGSAETSEAPAEPVADDPAGN